MKIQNALNLPSILDKEIDSVENDKFGHIHYARALYSLIKHNKPPFSIGLLGEWGVGKSSIKGLCIKEFLSKNQNDYETLDFNAWRYENKDIRESLLKEIFVALGGKEEDALTKIFREVSRLTEKNLELWPAIQNLFISIRLNLIILFITFLIILTLFFLLNEHVLTGLNTYSQLFLFGMLSFITSYFISKPYEYTASTFPRYVKETIKEMPVKHSLEYENLIFKQLKRFNKRNKKMIVFIDDLDRLNSKDMIAGLDAIRIFLEMPGSNLIFVVSCFDEHIANSIIKTKSTFADIGSARKYLDRVFQFRIDIPTMPNVSMHDFAREHIMSLVVFKEFEKDLVKSGINNIDTLLNVLIPIEVNSPRAVIQIVNSFMQAWWFANQREEKCDICKKHKCQSQKECLLIKNIITERIDILAITTVLKNQFPDFYSHLAVDSTLLKAILWKFLGLESCAVTLNSQHELLLKEYQLEQNGAIVIDNQGYYKFKNEHMNLQSYLSSIQTIEIPDNIRPFIMLLQDSLEREIGSDSIHLYEALITQNKSRLDDMLGIDNFDDLKLSELQTTQINKVRVLIDRKENLDRREKAYNLLTGIADRFDGISAKDLAENVAKTILDRSYIDKLDIQQVQKLINSNFISDESINKIFSYWTDALTTTKITNLTEFLSRDYYKNVLLIGLDLYYTKNKLDENNTSDLLRLLKVGTYIYTDKNIKDEIEAQKDKKMSISFYFEQIEAYGDKLLIDLGLNYVEDLLNHINTDKNADISKAIKEIDLIIKNTQFEQEALKGISLILLGGLAHNNEKIISYFIDCIEQNDLLAKIEKHFILEIIDSYVQRLIKHYSNKQFLVENVTQHLNNLVRLLDKANSFEDADADFSENLSTLVELIAKADNIIELELIFDKYQNLFNHEANIVLQSWVNKIFLTDEVQPDDLISDDLVKLIANKYMWSECVDSLSPLLSSIFEDESLEIEDINILKYGLFIGNINQETIEVESFREHISNMYAAFEKALINNQEDYFDSLFEITLPLFNHVKDENLDSLLSYILENYLSVETDSTEKFYSLFQDNWPREDKKLLPNYDILKIMENCSNLIQKTNTSLDRKKLFISIQTIVENGINVSNRAKGFITNSLMHLWQEHTEYSYNELQKYNDIMANSYNCHWLSPKTDSNHHKLLADFWKNIFTISTTETLTTRTRDFIEKYENCKDKDIWCRLLYEKFNNLDILCAVSTDIIKGGKQDFIEQCKFFTNFIIKNYDDEIKKDYAKAILEGYIAINDGNYKKSLLILMSKLLDEKAEGFFSKSIIEKSIEYKNDVTKLHSKFPQNRALMLMFSRIKTRRRKKLK